MTDIQTTKHIQNIAVSVIVAVYNREELLPRCLDSLVYQTLENIEIIVVDDFSTDQSWAVMEEWQARFPDKIRIMKSDRKGVFYTKNKGIKAARGQYVSLVDSDDYVDYKMFKRMYKWAENHKFPELIHSPIISVSPDRKWNRGAMKKHDTIADYLKLDVFFLPGKLWRRDLFERFGYLPEFQIGEDTSWAFPVISYLQHVEYYSTPSYYYELSANSVSLNQSDPSLVEDIIAGSRRIIDQVNPRYKDLAIIYALLRVYSLSLSRQQYKKQTDTFLLENMHLLEGIDDVPARLQNKIADLMAGTFSIPRTIYVNGFCTDSLPVVLEECQKALCGPCYVMVLDETNCSIVDAPAVVQEAYEAGNVTFVGKYFALLHCYNNGGIYLDADIEVDAPFDLLLGDPCFFGFESNERFTDKLFGSCPGNGCVQQILKTYEYSDLYNDPFAPLHERVKTVLVGSGNVLLRSGASRQLDRGFCLYPVEMFVCVLPGATDPHVCHYRAFGGQNEQELCIPVDILTALYERRIEIEKSKLNVQKIEKDRAWLQKKRKQLEGELNDYKRSPFVRVAWKCHQLLRKVKRKVLRR